MHAECTGALPAAAATAALSTLLHCNPSDYEFLSSLSTSVHACSFVSLAHTCSFTCHKPYLYLCCITPPAAVLRHDLADAAARRGSQGGGAAAGAPRARPRVVGRHNCRRHAVRLGVMRPLRRLERLVRRPAWTDISRYGLERRMWRSSMEAAAALQQGGTRGSPALWRWHIALG